MSKQTEVTACISPALGKRLVFAGHGCVVFPGVVSEVVCHALGQPSLSSLLAPQPSPPVSID